MRRGDRLVSAALLLSVVIALTLVPLFWMAGAATYSSVTERAAQATPVTATIESVGAADPTAMDATATVKWMRDGVPRTDTTVVPRGTEAGGTTTIWTGPNGTVVPVPPGPFERVLSAVMVATLGWGAAIGLLATAVAMLGQSVTRRHEQLWDREWDQASSENGWASH
uniref:Rv1733c family protein n=1 Tax=Gordonia rhizosphera TaxID=83341 RepID=UPI001FE10631|nr:hypothetical protein [Gordonia rhizosphera]